MVETATATGVAGTPSAGNLTAADSVIDALLDVDLPEVDPERAASDAEADRLAQAATRGGGTESTGKAARDGKALMSTEQAIQRLGPAILAALADKFNGSLTDIRHPDEHDMLL